MLNVSTLRCQMRQNPLGIDQQSPHFSWQLQSDKRNTKQTAYRIQVSTDWRFDAILWDTETVESDQCLYQYYQGPELTERTRYYARVTVWDNHGRQSDWSEIAVFETAFFHNSSWRAQWISLAEDPEGHGQSGYHPVPFLRREFQVDGPVANARVYASALGVYQLRLNGCAVGDHVLAPGWTSYQERLQYQTYDVTTLLQEGTNALGAMLGDGWYRGYIGFQGQKAFYGDQTALLVQLHITYSDGREEVVVSDPSWKAAEGPIIYSDIYNGEHYDGRCERDGWDAPGFDDGQWHPVTAADPGEEPVLVAQEVEPVRRIQELKPQRQLRTPDGDTVLDFGQNMVGWVRFTITAPEGTEVTLEHAEVLDQQGRFYTDNLRSAEQKITYVCRGLEHGETYEPHFTFQGFRYVRIKGFPHEVHLSDFTGVVLHSDLEVTGQFYCSVPLLNQLQQNILWGQRGNFLDIPTDCPQRDERLGWTGDAQMFASTAAFNMFTLSFFRKWLRDLAAEQREDGGVPHVIPNVLGDDAHSSAAWGDAATIIPWTMYLYYGDKGLLRQQYPSMKAWIEYIRSRSDGYLWNSGFHFGDWLSLDAPGHDRRGATDEDLIATAFFAYSASLVRQAAEVLGHDQDAAEYGELQEEIRRAFQWEFLTPSGRLAVPTQTAHILALMFDLVEEEQKPRLLETLVQDIKDKDIHLSTGFVGTPYLCFVLSDYGYTELAYSLLLQTEYPSWLYPITKGATTVWEHWDSIKEDGSFWPADMNSFNHYAYGAVGDWMYRRICGLQPQVEQPGFKEFQVYPHIGGGLTFAQADYMSVHGLIEAGWEIGDDKTTIRVTVPANTRASVWLPGKAEQARESSVPLQDADGIGQIWELDDGTLVDIGSGTFEFTLPSQT